MVKLKTAKACIIGSGAGGGVVAKELSQKGMSVVVLEAGRRFNPLQDYTASLNDWEQDTRSKFLVPALDTITLGNRFTGKPAVAYGVGGSTLRYLAYVPRMQPHDFQTHTIDSVGFDWPITYKDLEPYYRKVELELGVSGLHGDPWSPPRDPYPNPPFEYSYANKILKRGCDKLGIRLWPAPMARLSRPFDGRPACIQCGDCSSGCMTKAKSSVDVAYIPKAEATGRVEIRPQSVATQITVDAKGKAKGVIYFDENGIEHEQKAEIIIVSAGSIQSPRLLLNSKSSLFPDGLANSSGIVGKYFTQHLSVRSSANFSDRIDSFRGFFGGAFSLDFEETSPSNSYARGWAMELHSGTGGPARFAISEPGWGTRHKDLMRTKFGHVAGITAVGEQLPDKRNCIELDPEVVDEYGMPVPRISIEAGENDKLMVQGIKKQIREIYSAAGAKEISKLRYRPGSSAHNLGTCRMGEDAKESVVNDFCQCHDVPNLFVIDASCFVTGGTANPSLTIHAIATRAAEYIVKEAKIGSI